MYHQGPACTYLQVKDSFAGKGSWWKLESLTFWQNNNVCSGLHNWANGGGDHQKQKVSFLPHIFCNFYIFLQLLILFFATFDLVFLFILWYLLSGFNLSWFAHPDHKLLLCHMGKHGSTTWARCPRLNMFLFQVSPIAFKYFKTWSIFWTLVCFSYFYYMYTGQEPERPGPSMQTRARRWNIRNWGGFNIYISLEKQCCFINIVSLRWEDAAYSPRY